MKFSKITLFAAALIVGTASLASGKDILVEESDELVLEGGRLIYNVNDSQSVGAFLSTEGSLSHLGIADGDNFRHDDQTLVISGGGNLTYTGGLGKGSGYYTGSYSGIRGDNNIGEGSANWNSWESLDSFWSKDVYSGTLDVGAGTTLNLEGQLTQFVSFSRPTAPDAASPGAFVFGGYAGVSEIVLGEGATISFEGGAKNLVDARPNLGALNPTEDYNPKGVLHLNFLNNLKADAGSTIIIGSDEASINRIVLNADGDGLDASTVGSLKGNGRFYTTGQGTVSFLGKSALNSGTRLNEDGTVDTTGNTWLAGNRLADIILGTTQVNLGSVDGQGDIVNNVFENATAVHLISAMDPATSNAVTVGGSGEQMNGAADYIGNFAAGMMDVHVYGDQVFNNFQSLWIERSDLLADSDIGNPSSQSYEPVKFSYMVNGAVVRSTGSNTRVNVGADAVLTINQAKGRDGRYSGILSTTDGGLIVKTGKGRIFASSIDQVERLRIEDGEWVTSAVGGDQTTSITLANNGALTFIVSGTGSANFILQATDPTTVLNLSGQYSLENDLTTASLETVKSGEYNIEDLEYRKVEYTTDDSAANLQITIQQTQFYGKVAVNDGITLTLGSSNSSNSESVFSSAAAIELNGLGPSVGAGQKQFSTLDINGTQLVRNLSGKADSAAVTIGNGGTLVLTNTSANWTYSGGISGAGNFVKLGNSQQRISGNSNGELTGAIAVLSGSVSINQTVANAGSSALVLRAGTSASFSGPSKVGALIGEAGATVTFNGNLSVGAKRAPSGAANGSYFATSNYGAYDNYFTGTQAGALTTLKNSVAASRRFQTGTGGNATWTTVTTDDTLGYLKNPAELIYKAGSVNFDTSGNVEIGRSSFDGAFSKLFATTGTTARGQDVFTLMKTEGDRQGTYFGNATTVAQWLQGAFTTENVDRFIGDRSSQLSKDMEAKLRDLAEAISGSDAGVSTYLDRDQNLNATGWNKIVAAGGLELLRFLTGGEASLLSDMTDESLHSFITTFYGDYDFVLTQDNATQIGQIYGVDSSAWFNGVTPNYNELINSFGVSSGEFAGTLSGAGSLTKEGSETLTLTGKNAYTGKTLVQSGELRVNWNSIQRTSGIVIEAGALFTLNATKESIQEAFTNPDTGDVSPNDGYGDLFSGSRAAAARLSGAGTFLKVGDGNVDLGNALLDVASGEKDFTGSILVAEGAVRATVDAVARENLSFNLNFTDDKAVADASSNADAKFELIFAKTDGFAYLVGDKVAELEFAGTINGDKGTAKLGTFVLDAGTTRKAQGENDYRIVGNNILSVAASKFSVNTAEIKSGTLKIVVDTAGAQSLFSTALLGERATLFFDLENDATLSDATIKKISPESRGGNLVVAATEQDPLTDDYIQQILTLNDVGLTGIDGLELIGGAQLEISGSAKNPDIVLTSLVTGAQTELTLLADRSITLNGSGVIAGTLSGDGEFIFDGGDDGVLSLGNNISVAAGTVISAFSGEIKFGSGTIELVAGENQTVEYKGLTISDNGSIDPDRKLNKEGAGTVVISRSAGESNTIAVEELAINVNAGELAISGAVFTAPGTFPKSLAIAQNATFRFSDVFNGNFDFGDLGALSGAGTLAFTSTEATTISVSEFSADAFTGVVEVTNAGTTLNLGVNVTEFAAFSGAGTVHVEATDLTVRVNSNADGGEKFEGNLTGNLESLTVVGDGALAFGSGKVPNGVMTINVGSDTENGGLGVGNDWNGTVNLIGASTRVILSDAGADVFVGNVIVGENVENLNLVRDGEITLGENAISDIFKLQDATGEKVVLDGALGVPKITLSNVAGTNLTLKGIENLDAEQFELQTNGRDKAGNEGKIVFSGGTATWAKDITGEGGIALSGTTVLTLSSENLSYAGETLVGQDAILIFGDAGTRANSSKLTVSGGGTVVGGVDLVGENSGVDFSVGSTFVFTGDAIRFTGTAQVSGTGKMDVVLDSGALTVRGVPVALFKYIGAAGTEFDKNKISLDKINFIATEGALYYQDENSDIRQTGETVIYVATDDLSSVPGVKLHKGLSSSFVGYLSEIATPNAEGKLQTGLSAAEKKLADAIIKTPNGSLAGTLNNLAPLSYGAMLALPQSGFFNDISAITSRIEQRRYDNYTQFIWEIQNDWEFFAQGQGSFTQADEGGNDTRNFDMNSYGAIVGMDVKLSAASVAGFSIAYDHGTADVHNSGGEIASDDIRATAFFGKLFAERFYFDTGVQAGFAMFDVKRKTVLGDANGDATGWHAGAFANVGTLLPLWVSEDEKTTLNLMPFVGLAYSYYAVGAFDEDGAETALDTDSFGASSLRASVGASFALAFPWLGKTARANLDLAYTRELMDNEVDIDYTMPGVGGGEKFNASAIAFTEDTFSIGPRFSVELDKNNSIYGGYRFDITPDSDTSHSVNIGFRSRF